MIKPRKWEALKALCPNAEMALTGDVVTFDKLNGDSEPTNDQINAKLTELETEYDAKKYQRDRSIVYDSIQEQLDQLYWDKKNGTNKWVEAIDKVKSDNPKP
jgi:hypothetical protein